MNDYVRTKMKMARRNPWFDSRDYLRLLMKKLGAETSRRIDREFPTSQLVISTNDQWVIGRYRCTACLSAASLAIPSLMRRLDAFVTDEKSCRAERRLISSFHRYLRSWNLLKVLPIRFIVTRLNLNLIHIRLSEDQSCGRWFTNERSIQRSEVQ